MGKVLESMFLIQLEEYHQDFKIYLSQDLEPFTNLFNFEDDFGQQLQTAWVDGLGHP